MTTIINHNKNQNLLKIKKIQRMEWINQITCYQKQKKTAKI